MEKVSIAYSAAIVSSIVICANYNVIHEYRPGYSFKEFSVDAIQGAVGGIIVGIFSPVVAIGIPAYVVNKVYESFK